jgi:hypothetical protein
MNAGRGHLITHSFYIRPLAAKLDAASNAGRLIPVKISIAGFVEIEAALIGAGAMGWQPSGDQMLVPQQLQRAAGRGIPPPPYRKDISWKCH